MKCGHMYLYASYIHIIYVLWIIYTLNYIMLSVKIPTGFLFSKHTILCFYAALRYWLSIFCSLFSPSMWLPGSLGRLLGIFLICFFWCDNFVYSQASILFVSSVWILKNNFIVYLWYDHFESFLIMLCINWLIYNSFS